MATLIYDELREGDNPSLTIRLVCALKENEADAFMVAAKDNRRESVSTRTSFSKSYGQLRNKGEV